MSNSRAILYASLGCVVLAGLGCSAGDGSSGGRSPSGTAAGAPSVGTGTGAGSLGSGSGSSAAGGFGNSMVATMTNNTIKNPNAVPGAQGATTVARSFIWIANSAEGTVSKLDTRTMKELGRYLTSPSGKGLPSRTSVAGDGSVAVANRSNATGWMGDGGGGVVKIFSSPDKCKDKNGNGMIDTSTGAMDVKPWGQDECVAWFTPLMYFSNRPVAWAPAPGPDIPANVWTSAASACTSMMCSVDVFRLNGETGAIENMITVSGLTGVDFISAGLGGGGMPDPNNPLAGLLGAVGGGVIDNYGAYGGAADGGGNFWLFIANTTQLVRVDAVTLQYQAWPIPMGNGYGITIHKGRVFICGKLGLSRFDPPTATWLNTFDGGGMSGIDLGFNGCMTDGASKVWVGGGSDQGMTGLFGFDAETLALVDQVSMDAMGRAMQVKGVSIDVDGGIWGVSSPGATKSNNGNIAWRFDPMTRMVANYDGLNGAYSYSDMTGFGLEHAGVLQPHVM